MANNTVTVSGMFGSGKTYFAGSPVVIDISGLEWPAGSPFNIVRVEVTYNGRKTGEFSSDTGGQSAISFDISSALRAIWSDYDFQDTEVAMADAALSPGGGRQASRGMRGYSITVYTEYMSSDDGGVFTSTAFGPFTGGRCMLGGLTERERYSIGAKENADASYWNRSNDRYGDASTKPWRSQSLERVGSTSITSWTDIGQEGTQSVFFPAPASHLSPAVTGEQDGATAHAPLVLRDSVPYTDFLFLNRRGAVESCSARMLEAMETGIEKKTYSRVERASFRPSRSVMAVRQGDPRRKWSMSSGHQTREWAEWWASEFLSSERHWMLYEGAFVPVIVEPARKDTGIYDSAKQQMPSVEFTVTMALEG